MKSNKLTSSILFVIALLFAGQPLAVHAQDRQKVQSELLEYTNPDEMVSFDRNTTFSRALDVINEFAQKYKKKVVVDRTETKGPIGVKVPAMQWMDALNFILNVKRLRLVERPDYYEIVPPKSTNNAKVAKSSGGGGKEGEGPVATTKTHEVRINAIFFEGNRRALQEIGVDWSTISQNVPNAILGGGSGGSSGGGGGGGQGQGQSQQIPDSRFDNGPFVQVNSKGAKDVSQNVFNAIVNVGEIGNTGIDVQALFSAFQADNLGQILASPTIKVVDGQEGRIQVGQDFSIKQRDFAGNVVENFFSVGTILEVTPQVIDQNDTTFIHLTINAERSTAQPDPVSTIINKQEATTQALLLNGETTVIAGLYNTETTEVRRGVPILKDLPAWFFGLRYLFGYNSKDFQSRELVVLIKASLEPSIPERYDPGNYKDKFKVLQGERNRMKRDAKRARKVMSGKEIDEKPVRKDREMRNESTERQDRQFNSKPEREPKRQQTEEPKSDEVNQRNMTGQNEEANQKAEPEVVDPEAQGKEVPLNLGGEDKNSEFDKDMEMDKDIKEDTADIHHGEPVSVSNNSSTPKQNEKPANTDSPKASKSYNYYIVGGSFRNVNSAKDLKSKMQKKGFNAVILQKPNSEIQLVTYGGYKTIDEAKSALADIQQNQNEGAWVYHAK